MAPSAIEMAIATRPLPAEWPRDWPVAIRGLDDAVRRPLRFCALAKRFVRSRKTKRRGGLLLRGEVRLPWETFRGMRPPRQSPAVSAARRLLPEVPLRVDIAADTR